MVETSGIDGVTDTVGETVELDVLDTAVEEAQVCSIGLVPGGDC